MPQAGPGKNGFGVDYGRFNSTFDDDDLYKFRTPPLHNVLKTGPFGHSGSLADVRDVIEAHYDPFSFFDFSKMDSQDKREIYKRAISTSDAQPVPNSLTKDEISDLISFLRALSFIQ